MISIFLLKTALLRFGIIVQDISFDVDHECIQVNYTLNGGRQRKSISFSDIEDLFKSDSEAPAGPEADDNPPPGYTAI